VVAGASRARSLSVYLPIYISIYLSVYLPIDLPIYLSIYLSLSISLSVFLSLSLPLSLSLSPSLSLFPSLSLARGPFLTRLARKLLEALRGGIPCSFLEPLARSWSHFVGIYCQKLTTSLKKWLWHTPTLAWHRAPRSAGREPKPPDTLTHLLSLVPSLSLSISHSL